MTDDDVTTDPRIFPALTLMERRTPPTLYGRGPFWRPPIHPVSHKVFIPSWTWQNLIADDDPDTITLDVNGAFMAAIGTVKIAMGGLQPLGQPLDATDLDPRKIWPGYYQVSMSHWAFAGTLVSPLGTEDVPPPGRRFWIAAPTLELLLELLLEGSIGELNIHDALVCSKQGDFRAWNAALKTVRDARLDDIAKAETDGKKLVAKVAYKKFKEGYSSALSIMLTGNGGMTRRPDWAHTVYARHAAASWRKAWKFSAVGPVLAMGRTDELTVTRTDLTSAIQSLRPPIKLDPSGRILGHYKEKENDPERDQVPAEVLALADDFVYADGQYADLF